jgi:Metallopeptidase toxin 3
MPDVAKVDTIISAIHKYAGAVSKSTIKDALMWGQGPMIKIVSGLTCGGAGAVGCFRFGTSSNDIEIEDWTVKAFRGRQRFPQDAQGPNGLSGWCDTPP